MKPLGKVVYDREKVKALQYIRPLQADSCVYYANGGKIVALLF